MYQCSAVKYTSKAACLQFNVKSNNYNFPCSVIKIANCKLYTNYCSVHPVKNFLPELSSVVKHLPACFGVHSASVNCVLKPALQASSHNVLISCSICLIPGQTKFTCKNKSCKCKNKCKLCVRNKLKSHSVNKSCVSA